MGTGGIASCDSCGMQYTQERMKEKVQEIKGTVQVDNSHLIENWMRMGSAAAEAGNNKEAYDYFAKVIEIDSQNWRAIFEKGKAGAWQSTLGNLRIPEIYQGIGSALKIIDGLDYSIEELCSIKNEFAVALFNINNAITDLMEQNLSNVTDKYFDIHWDQMWETRQRFLTNVEQLEDAMTLISDLSDELSTKNVIEFKKRICKDLRSACDSIQYWTDYSQKSLAYLGFSTSEKQPYLNKFWDIAYSLRKTDPDFARKSDEQNLPPNPFNPGLNFLVQIRAFWEKADIEWDAKVKKQMQQERCEEYWCAHRDEKDMLEAKKTSCTNQIVQTQHKISQILNEPEKIRLQEIVNSLVANKKALGIFKSKEKKAIQEEIDTFLTKINTIDERIASEISKVEATIERLYKQVAEIDEELTRDR